MRFLAVLLVVATVAPVALAADGEPKKALTKQGQAAAASIVLKRADLGAGFVATKRSDDPLPKEARCDALDEGDLTVSGDASSPDFRLAGTGVYVTVGSSVHVYRTLEEANSSWARGTSRQVLNCLSDIVRLSAAPGQKISVVSSERVAFPRLAPKTNAYRVVVTIATGAGSQKIRAYVDAVVLQRGKIQSVLLVTSLGRPVAQAERAALASILAARMARKAGAAGPVA